MPIVLLTARSTEDDVLLGFDLGADDYITKPFRPRQMVARVRTILRRTGRARETSATVLKVGDLMIDPIRHEVRIKDELVNLTPAEFRLLARMAAQPQRVFTREQLLEDGFITARTVDVHMMKLRRKIEAQPDKPAHILTVYGYGYKLVI